MRVADAVDLEKYILLAWKGDFLVQGVSVQGVFALVRSGNMMLSDVQMEYLDVGWYSLFYTARSPAFASRCHDDIKNVMPLPWGSLTMPSYLLDEIWEAWQTGEAVELP